MCWGGAVWLSPISSRLCGSFLRDLEAPECCARRVKGRRGTASWATISAFRPRILLETYHRPDDMEVLPAILFGANPGYTAYCGDCEFTEDPANWLVPHFIDWE